MVDEVTTVGELSQAFKPKAEEFQSELYEYVDDHMRIRARSKAGGLDHPPNVYVSVRLYGMYEALKDRETITADTIEKDAVSGQLAYLEKIIAQHTEADTVQFEFRQIEDGGSVTFDGSFERLEE